MRSMITATNTMSQLQKQMDTIGHNLANLDTIGYKGRHVNFSELLFQQMNNQSNAQQEVGRLTPNGIRQGVGARLGHTNVSLALGSIKTTERPLDIALTKENQFLQVMVEENGVQATRFTRAGALYLTPANDGTNRVALVNSDGNPVLDQDGEPIEFNDNFKEISISSTGEITVIPADTGLPNEVFSLSVVEINRPQLLEAVGDNLLALPNLNELGLAEEDVLTSLQGDLRQQVSMKQGALEQSNVDMSAEMSDLLLTQRSYQFNAKSISISDQMMGLVNGIR